MPKIDITAVSERNGTSYPLQFNGPCAERVRQRLGDAGGLSDFGFNLMHLPPGNWSSQRLWHSHEDEFVYVLDGELTLIGDDGETVLCAGARLARDDRDFSVSRKLAWDPFTSGAIKP